MAQATVHKPHPKATVLEIEAVQHTSRGRPPLTVAVAPPKGERADWLVEKLGELGIDHLIWVTSERSVGSATSLRQKSERWRRLVAAAARQSNQTHLTTLDGPWPLEAWLKGHNSSNSAHKLLLTPQAPPLVWPKGPLPAQGLMALVGPEGGFSGQESALAVACGWQPVGLGATVLRVETAAVVAAAHLVHHVYCHADLPKEALGQTS